LPITGYSDIAKSQNQSTTDNTDFQSRTNMPLSMLHEKLTEDIIGASMAVLIQVALLLNFKHTDPHWPRMVR
jgi:hypothetical protein